jgi:TetR/AcrR family transcriptional repressor of mexJK operon
MRPQAEPQRDSNSPKRRAIVTAAGDLFVAHGYGAVSMDAIARAAAVSKATLYAHFPSKDVLFATIIREACQEGIRVGGFTPAADQDIREALAGLARRLMHFLMEPRPLAIYRVVVSESARFPELGRAFYDAGPATFRVVFGDWLVSQHEAGRMRVDDPEMAADQFISMLRGGLYMRATLGLAAPPWDDEIEATVQAAVTAFSRAYAAS